MVLNKETSPSNINFFAIMVCLGNQMIHSSNDHQDGSIAKDSYGSSGERPHSDHKYTSFWESFLRNAGHPTCSGAETAGSPSGKAQLETALEDLMDKSGGLSRKAIGKHPFHIVGEIKEIFFLGRLLLINKFNLCFFESMTQI